MEYPLSVRQTYFDTPRSDRIEINSNTVERAKPERPQLGAYVEKTRLKDLVIGAWDGSSVRWANGSNLLLAQLFHVVQVLEVGCRNSRILTINGFAFFAR
jgi:hypothetical protein